MKNIYFILLFASCIFLSFPVTAQECPSDSSCSTTVTLSSPGLINLDSIPCIVDGVPYSYAIPLQMYTNINVDGPQEVDSVQFTKILNLPCGLCWSTSEPDNLFSSGQNGCIKISGTTNDTAGQYKLLIYLNAWINHTGIEVSGIPPAQVDAAGIRLIARVKTDAGATCNPVDTSSTAPNLTANCATAIDDIPGYISRFSVYPNPLNSDAVVSFTAIEGGTYTLKLTDITGRTLRENQLQVRAGVNNTGLQRQGLPTGLYFISLSNGQGMVTKKLLVTE